MTVERRKRDFKTQLKTKWADWGFIAVMLAVPLLNLLIFYFGVNINSVLLAFKENIGGETVFSLYNFQRLFKEFASSASVVNEALKNTLIFFFLSFIIITPLSLIFAYFLYKKIYGYKIFRFVFFLPSIISATVLTTLYKQLILPDGVISQLVRLVGGEVPLLGYLATEDTALWAIVVYTLWTGFGVNIILFSGAMSKLPEEVMEYAKIDGVGTWRELVQIIIPMIWPTVSTMLTFAIVGLFTASGPILLFTKGQYGTYTISFWIFDLVQGVDGVTNFEYASAVGLFFTLVGVPIVMTVRHFINKLVEIVEY